MWLAIKRRVDRYLLRDPAFRFVFDEPAPGEAVAIDCETTGLDPRRDDIVTVAAVPIRAPGFSPAAGSRRWSSPAPA